MSLKKKDPSNSGGLRVAANDPHFVSLGGGRLSTAVTIHYIPVGDTTIGSSPSCCISLNGSGVRGLHCTVIRNGQGEVTIIPENDARVLIDGNKIISKASLTQGAMLTIGNSNYLRFNNPAEAQLIKSTMGSNERISMPQIDFTQDPNGSNRESPEDILKNFNDVNESQKYQKLNTDNVLDKIAHASYININNFHSPKVFTADSITVNAPAKDVLGPKYANFAKNLAENHKNDKHFCTKNNEVNLKTSNYVNIPPSFIQNSPNNSITEVLTKVNNCTAGTIAGTVAGGSTTISTTSTTTFSSSGSSRNQQFIASSYDRYPKPGSYGGLQLFPMNGVNSEINTRTNSKISTATTAFERSLEEQRERAHAERINEEKISAQEQERLEEIVKICTEYDRQNQNSNSVQSSPIVQNRIKTNGSLPRDKKSPFYDINCSTQSPHHSKTFFSSDKPKTGIGSSNSGYENVKIFSDRRIEIGAPSCGNGINSNSNSSNGVVQKISSGYENVIVGKYIPQSPRTKIRTTCVSPKKDPTNIYLPPHQQQQQQQYQQQQQHKQSVLPPANHSNDYASLIQSFEDKLRLEMEAIKETGKVKQYKQKFEDNDSAKKRQNRNINNLTLNLKATAETNNVDKDRLQILKKDRDGVLSRIRKLKTQIAELERQEDEVLRELDMERALVSGELESVTESLVDTERNFASLQTKIHRLEAQRNANRVMQETQQAKLKQSIEVKQEQVSALEKLSSDNETDEALKEELNTTFELLENDTKTFEDLEFQYLEEETDWLAYREELHTDLKMLSMHIDEKRQQMRRLESQSIDNQNTACSDTKTLENTLLSLLTSLEKSREELQGIDKSIFEISGQQQTPHSDTDEEDLEINKKPNGKMTNLMSQSLFGSAEILSSAKPKDIDIMSKSVNENMFFHNIEMLPAQLNATSTPKKNLKIFDTRQSLTDVVDDEDEHVELRKTSVEYSTNGVEITPEIVSRDRNSEEEDPILKLKYNVQGPNDEAQKKVNLNLSLGSDDFEVNPLERRVPSQDDIDRICKVTSDAPISTKGASSKIIESIKEIERNRQLLLAQQGCHVIEHERQKIVELKKKSHDEARAQYLSSQGEQKNGNGYKSAEFEGIESGNRCSSPQEQQETRPISSESENRLQESESEEKTNNESSQQRHSHPDLDLQRQRPLSDANSELSYDNLSDKQFKSNNDLLSSNNRLSENSDDARRSSMASNDTMDGDRLVSGSKRALPKHQRPLTRYLPIMSTDLDLRQHIETAGHQVTLCPHVYVDSSSCRGYLHKLGATFHGWSRRWFVLDRLKSAFIYYSDKAERKPRGGAYFSTIDEVYLDHLNTSKSGRPHCTFIVKTKKRSYHLQAASDAAARIWIDAIITGAQGNIDY